jgi:hypothetical protein
MDEGGHREECLELAPGCYGGYAGGGEWAEEISWRLEDAASVAVGSAEGESTGYFCTENYSVEGWSAPVADCMFKDCDDQCVPESLVDWLGDGYCDDGPWDINLNCEALNFDNGDCDSSTCSFVDCDGACAEGVQHYVGDGSCDEGGWGFSFNCAEFDFDGGDCSSASPSSECATYDCIGACADNHLDWIGDGACDNGEWGVYFNCGTCEPLESALPKVTQLTLPHAQLLSTTTVATAKRTLSRSPRA